MSLSTAQLAPCTARLPPRQRGALQGGNPSCLFFWPASQHSPLSRPTASAARPRGGASCRPSASLPPLPCHGAALAPGGGSPFAAAQHLRRPRPEASRSGRLRAKGGRTEDVEAEAPQGGGGEVEKGGRAAAGEGRRSALDIGTSAAIWLFWAAFVSYAFLASPNQTPYRDQFFVKKLVGLGGDDDFRMNQVLVCLWYIMGVIPLVYAQLLIPSARSKGGRPPVWPFAVASAFVGAFALLPYFALWSPTQVDNVPSEAERQSRPLRALDSKIAATLAAFGAVGLVGAALAAGGTDWTEFFQYFRESRFVHVTSIDFVILTTFLPFFAVLDMGVRKWSGREKWWIPFAVVPLLGPALYLLVRPPLPPPPPPGQSED